MRPKPRLRARRLGWPPLREQLRSHRDWFGASRLRDPRRADGRIERPRPAPLRLPGVDSRQRSAWQIAFVPAHLHGVAAVDGKLHRYGRAGGYLSHHLVAFFATAPERRAVLAHRQ